MRIEQATPKDRAVLIEVFLALLKHVAQFGHDTPPTHAAAQWYVDHVFLPAAERGDPVLIARPAAPQFNEALGAVFWCRVFGGVPGTENTAFGYGTFVKDCCQRSGVGTALRKAAIEQLRVLGVKRIVGQAAAGNLAGRKSLEAMGFKPTNLQYELKV